MQVRKPRETTAADTGCMDALRNRIRRVGHEALCLAVVFATSSAFAFGDLPPERKGQKDPAPGACSRRNAATPAPSEAATGGADCDSTARSTQPASSATKSPMPSPERFGKGYEARRGLGGAARGGRGAGR